MQAVDCFKSESCKYYNKWNRCYPDCLDFLPNVIIKAGLKHGDSFECPTCGAPCRIDINTPSGKEPEFELSAWYNKHIPGWECTECWLK